MNVVENDTGTRYKGVVDPYAGITNVFVPEAHLHITCPCGQTHKINLNDLPASTAQRVQVKTECPFGEYFIVHSGHSKYRKILIIAEFGE